MAQVNNANALATKVQLSDYNSDAHAQNFSIMQKILQINTISICKVVGISNKPKSYNLRQVINYLDNRNNPIEPPIIYDVPLMDIAGSGCGVEIVHAIGDIVVVGFNDRDLTNVKTVWNGGSNITNQVNPNSSRMLNIADGIILGNFSPTVPTIKVKITPSGIDIVGNSQPITITTSADITTTCNNSVTNCTNATITASATAEIDSPSVKLGANAVNSVLLQDIPITATITANVMPNPSPTTFTATITASAGGSSVVKGAV